MRKDTWKNHLLQLYAAAAHMSNSNDFHTIHSWKCYQMFASEATYLSYSISSSNIPHLSTLQKEKSKGF